MTGRGGISITAGDRDRISQHEYLNDTLIEFGLKRIFADLPEAQQSKIHFFNSFFYKKLSVLKKRAIGELDSVNGVTSWEGYESVKKWTAKGKVDIFEKDLIIVPINEHLHWYLAVIYNPKGVLQRHSSPEVEPDTIETMPIVIDDATDEGFEELTTSNAGIPLLTRAVEAVRTVSAYFEGGKEAQKSIGVSPSSGSGVSIVDMGIDFDADPAENDTKSKSSSPVPLDTRTTRRNLNRSASPEQKPTALPKTRPAAPRKSTAPVKRSIFGHNGAWILVFDSLSGNHPAVGKKLGRWLEHEARFKRDVDYPITPAEHFDVRNMLLQNNQVDCGVYVLNAAERIMKEPERVIKFIEKPSAITGASGTDRRERDSVWGAADVTSKRAEWLAVIDSLTHQFAATFVQEEAEESDHDGEPILADDYVATLAANEAPQPAEVDFSALDEVSRRVDFDTQTARSPSTCINGDLRQDVAQLSLQPPWTSTPPRSRPNSHPPAALATPLDARDSLSPDPPSPQTERYMLGSGLRSFLPSKDELPESSVAALQPLPGKDLSAGWTAASSDAPLSSEEPEQVEVPAIDSVPETPEKHRYSPEEQRQSPQKHRYSPEMQRRSPSTEFSPPPHPPKRARVNNNLPSSPLTAVTETDNSPRPVKKYRTRKATPKKRKEEFEVGNTAEQAINIDSDSE